MSRPIGLVIAALVVAVAGCPAAPANKLSLASSGAVVDVTLQPFSWSVKNPAGAVVLNSLSAAQ